MEGKADLPGHAVPPASLPHRFVCIPRLSGFNPAWFALYVQVNHEKEVARRLEQKCIESYLPLMECWSKRRDRRKKIQVPLFPGYVFVHMVHESHSNLDILRTPGALSLVRNSQGAISIEPCQIDNLKLLLGTRMPINAHPYLREGHRVEVLRGPLAGCVGVLVRHNPGKGRLVVSIDMIQRSVCVELDVEDVEPVATASNAPAERSSCRQVHPSRAQQSPARSPSTIEIFPRDSIQHFNISSLSLPRF